MTRRPPVEFWGGLDGLDVATITITPDVNVSIGDPLLFHRRPNYCRRPTLLERALTALRSAVLSVLWWQLEMYEAIDVQTDRGVVACKRLRWSWRRWRWEVTPPSAGACSWGEP